MKIRLDRLLTAINEFKWNLGSSVENIVVDITINEADLEKNIASIMTISIDNQQVATSNSSSINRSIAVEVYDEMDNQDPVSIIKNKKKLTT